ncbi:MAG: hypothetical protein HZB30_07920 [Nitrospirae bacterium]|nr:hypothetical protein [Nitrospirota bacterium]
MSQKDTDELGCQIPTDWVGINKQERQVKINALKDVISISGEITIKEDPQIINFLSENTKSLQVREYYICREQKTAEKEGTPISQNRLNWLRQFFVFSSNPEQLQKWIKENPYPNEPKDEEQKHMEIRGNVINSQIIQVNLSEVDFEKIKSDDRQLESLKQDLKTTKTLIFKKEIETVSSYFPSGYKKENFFIGPTELSEKLKKVFNFVKENFGKQIKGKQFNEIDSLITEIIKDEHLLPYSWFYRGAIYSFISVNNPNSEETKKFAISYLEQADNLFNFLLDKNPENSYLLLYKGMNLSFLNKGRESVLYLNEALRINPELFSKHYLLGFLSYRNDIESKYAEMWELALKKYETKD